MLLLLSMSPLQALAGSTRGTSQRTLAQAGGALYAIRIST